MSRITNDARESIVVHAMKGRFDDRKAALEKARTVLADALYEYAFGAEAEKARALPARWVARSGTLCITSEGWGSKYVSGKGNVHGPERVVQLSKDQPLPAVITDELTVKVGHPLWKQTSAIVKEFHKIKDDEQALRTKLYNLLRSVTTFKRLREVWPEGEQFFPAQVRQTALVPVTLTRDINRMLGIEPTPNAAKSAIVKAAS